jgi:hypothetical protein
MLLGITDCVGGGGSGGGELGCVGAIVVLTIVTLIATGFVYLIGWVLTDAGVM